MDLEKAIGAHGEWKMKFRVAIADKAKLDEASIKVDNACPLGKWLHGEGKTKYGKLDSHAHCLAKHAAFHREAGKVATTINAGQYDKATEMIGQNSDYSRASTEVRGGPGRLDRFL